MSLSNELVGSGREALQGSRRIGPADPAERAEISVYLRRRPLADPIRASELYGAVHPFHRPYLSRQEFASKFGASDSDVAAVGSFADRSGLKMTQFDQARRSLQLSGSVEALCRAFGVDLGRYQSPLGPYRGREGALLVPDGLEGRLVGVFGLDQRVQVRTHFRVAQTREISYSPAQVGAAYEFPDTSDGSGQCIGILEFGGGYRPQDLASFFATAKSPVPNVTVVSVDGASNAPSGDPNGPDAEVELDVEMAGALAPGAALVVYFAPNNDQGFLDALTTAIHDTVHHPNILSISWGGPEASWTQQAMTVFNQACEDAAALGITVVAAAGDNGATDGEPAGTLAVDFPASSPYVLACGGTRLVLDVSSGGRITEEVVWNDLVDHEGATGGGVSQVFRLPAYQNGAQVPAGEGGFLGRGVPDVAGDADPRTGYSVFVDGAETVIGGTSAVAPLWAALIARLNQGLGAPLGWLQPLAYQPPESATFHEITEGNNGGFAASSGWNACTGLGSPNGKALLASLAKK